MIFQIIYIIVVIQNNVQILCYFVKNVDKIIHKLITVIHQIKNVLCVIKYQYYINVSKIINVHNLNYIAKIIVKIIANIVIN